MPKGSPNDASKTTYFRAMVYDPKLNTYKPLYELPDATDKIQGGVFLSDAVDKDANAATGVEAASPKAVKTVNDKVNKKLDKEAIEKQTVAGPVAFTKPIEGTIQKANQLTNKKNITVSVGAGGYLTEGLAAFDGSENATINIQSIRPESIRGGVLDMSVIPRGALERLVRVADEAARFNLTSATVQTGDTVLQQDIEKMFFVVDDTRLNQAAGYQEYKVGTAGRLGTDTVGSNDKKNNTAQPIWIYEGVPKPIDAPIGNSQQPVFLENGVIKPINATIAKSVPANAVFTDTTYSPFKPASSGTNGEQGLVPSPKAGEQSLFLRGDGQWAEAGKVKTVCGKGADSQGDVKLQANDVSALSTTGGILTGGLSTCDIAPVANNRYSLGSSTTKWNNVYAEHFHGIADSATVSEGLTSGIRLLGDITAPLIGMNSAGPWQLQTSISNGAVKKEHLDSSIGIVATSANIEPTDPHVQIWINTAPPQK